MPLHLYRRHFRQKARCAGGHAPDSQSYESDELRPKWRKCGCPIYASGTLNGNPKFRKNTGRVTWEEARFVVAAWERGEDTPSPASPPHAPSDGKERTTIDRAIELYLNNRRSRGVRPNTVKKYTGFTNQLKAWTDKKGYVYLDQFTVLNGDEFYESWTDGPKSRGKKLERMKGFFEFCRKRKLISDNPVEALEPPVGYSVPNSKMPFTDEELERIVAAAEDWTDTEWHDGRGHHGMASREQVIAFVLLSAETGLRISDVCSFNVADRVNLDTGDCFLRMHKTGKPLYTWINPDLRARLQTLALKHGAMPFDLPSKDLQHKTEVWRDRLAKVFEASGPFKEKATPHRFRHTFARILLQRGVPVPDVAELIGDTPEMLRRHYAPWVPELQARLTDILKKTYEANQKKKWRARVVSMPKNG
ncbi:MAG: tyrosine-type recombinase/integrase [Acidobacteria bacterium]|nr:tyrosine-type recombinase/integrase [Acidobacteriota bacterium]